jgi:hypothetical protein
MKVIQRICEKLSKALPSLTIRLPDPKTGIKQDYLSRFYVFLADREFGNIFIHEFHSSDLDIGEKGFGLLHNHPFRWSFSFVLINGYWEERLNPDQSITKKFIKPFSFNFLSRKDFHRVDLVDGKKAWTLFFTGPRSSRGSWGFYDRVTKQYRDWTTSPNAIK